MTDLPRELIDAILAAPTDDAPRLACADWLEEQGDPEAAAFVRSPTGEGGIGRLAALAPLAAGGHGLSAHRGFLDRVMLRGRVSPEVLREVARHPFVTTIDHQCALDDAAGGLTPADLALLAPLRGLKTLRLWLDAPELAWRHLAPLVALPCLTGMDLFGPDGESLLEDRWRSRWQAARWRAAAGRSPADARLAARSAMGVYLAERADGACAATASSAYRGVRLLSALPELRALALSSFDLPAYLGRCRGLRSLSLNVRTSTEFRPANWETLAVLREVVVGWPEGQAVDWAGLAECLARLPRLEALTLLGPGPPPPALLVPLTNLRVLHTPQLGIARDAPTLGWPHLREWATDFQARALGGLDPSRFPELQRFGLEGGAALLRPPGGWRRRFPDSGAMRPADAAERDAYGGVERTFPAEGVSLRVPVWLAEVPTPAPEPRTPEIVPLAAWREWGEPGESDDLMFGPTRVRLERIDGPLTEAEAARLVGPAERIETERVRLATHSWASEEVAFGPVVSWRVRHLWRRRDRALRLSWDASRRRLADVLALAAEVAKGFRWG